MVPGTPYDDMRALLAEAQATKKIGNFIESQCREIINGRDTAKQR